MSDEFRAGLGLEPGDVLEFAPPDPTCPCRGCRNRQMIQGLLEDALAPVRARLLDLKIGGREPKRDSEYQRLNRQWIERYEFIWGAVNALRMTICCQRPSIIVRRPGPRLRTPPDHRS